MVKELSSESTTPGVVAAMKSILFDEKMSDISLKGSDGIETPAVRAILSSRSKVFSKMFFDDFLEAKSQVVELHLNSDTIRALVTYCYTDNIRIADVDVLKITKKEDFKEFEENVSCQFIDEMMKLAEAADYFEPDGLEDTLKKWARKCLHYVPSLAVTTFAFCHEDDRESEVIRYFKQVSKDVICYKFIHAMLKPDIHIRFIIKEQTTNDCSKEALNLSASALGEIMKWRNLNVNEFSLFFCLNEWSKHSTVTTDVDNNVRKKMKTQSRKEDAKDIAKHINLLRIAPWNLIEVRKSGLVEEENIIKAFEKHSLILESLSDQNSYFDMLKKPRASFPSKITVEDAGLSAVNGTYESGGLYDGVDFYVKEGFWEGKQEIFYVYREQEKIISWIICITQGKPLEESYEGIHFYSSWIQNGKDALIPPSQWTSHFEFEPDAEEYEPTPTVSYVREKMVML